MQVRYLSGPAGSGKTFRCLTEIRNALSDAPEGPALILVAPKQTTYQLERELLAHPDLPGYTRLQILSFERLGYWIFEHLDKSSPDMLDEEGRVMVLRSLLTKKRDQLKLFRASARLTGFAQQLSLVLGELQRNQQTPETLLKLAEQIRPAGGLSSKLQDFAALLQDYLDWLQAHKLQDADCLLQSAVLALEDMPRSALRISHLWVDGFAGWSGQELDLLAALIPHCEQATLTFCLDRLPQKISWLSNWSMVQKSYQECKRRLDRVPEIESCVESLPRDPATTRFLDKPVLQHLERFWAEPKPYEPPQAELTENRVNQDSQPLLRQVTPSVQLEWLWPGNKELESKIALPSSRKVGPKKWKPVELVPAGKAALATKPMRAEGTFVPAAMPERPVEEETPALPSLEPSLRVAVCVEPEAEVILAAREILRHVRAGGRYREVTVLVRKLAAYHEQFQRIFSRYDIPFFMDRRESVSHHPLPELTRSALRMVVSDWKHEEWFGALKTGLVRVKEEDVDQLENEALARGWMGATWHQPIRITAESRSPEEQQRLGQLEIRLEQLRRRIVPPFEKLALTIGTLQNKPNGQQLAAALRELWTDLGVKQTLEEWTDQEASDSDSRMPNSAHTTVWEQINLWLENLELAFPTEALRLREWLPIIDAGLGTLTVGVIPPALDQVLIGAIDRSRNPDIKLALILGLNESVFPATPEASVLLTDADRAALEQQNVSIGSTKREQLGQEQYLGYIACTRARQRLVLTTALNDASGAPLYPSPFLARIKQLFPSISFNLVARTLDWRESEHATEIVGPLLRLQGSELQAQDEGTRSAEPGSVKPRAKIEGWEHLAGAPALAAVLERVKNFRAPKAQELLAPDLTEQLYGSVLNTSVSRMEQFAACPFKFFVHSGLKAEERKLFELDAREQGSFQHDVLAAFHLQLRRENKRWRDISPEEARERIARIARALAGSFRDGLMQHKAESRFTARVLTESLQDFAETLVGWMREQYRFDPVEVELPFGEDATSPAWMLSLNHGRELALRGRIDRVDLWRQPDRDEALCVVVDYKSSQKQLDPVLLANGLQLQLLAYLNVLRHWPDPQPLFGARRLIPAGVFYVNLKGKYRSARHRREALADPERKRKLAYQHLGRFDIRALRQLDGRPNAMKGDQFNYRLTGSGEIYKNCRDPMPAADFEGVLDSIEANLKRMGQMIFSGSTEVAPYRKGSVTACSQCDYRAICRIDPWTHQFRVLKKIDEGEAVDE